jgi:hypothetical protein
MLYKLNSSVKEKPTVRINTIFNRSLPESLNQTFIGYLDEFNQTDDIKELANKINWKSIIDIYKNECNELRSQFSIPKVIDGLKVKNLDVTFYSLVIKTTVHSLFYSLYLLLKDQIASKDSPESLDDNLTRDLNLIIKQYVSSYYFQLELTRIRADKDKPLDQTAVEKFKELANLGKAFSRGKSFELKEIPVFKLILQEYNKVRQTDSKKSYKKIAYFMGRTEFGLLTNEGQQSFYKRFISYKNSTQK